MKRCFAIYRRPDEADRFRLVESDHAARLYSPKEADGRVGFLIAPFEATAATPLVMIEGKETVASLPAVEEEQGDVMKEQDKTAEEASRVNYHEQFAVFHAAIRRGECSKLVLARRVEQESEQPVSPLLLFRRACASFPHCFIALFSTPETGMWLTATPEILLEREQDQFHTMALAGTMLAPANEDTGEPWSEKNRTEQRFVARYVLQHVMDFTDRVKESPARTFVAGNVMHLRSDFFFTPHAEVSFGTVAAALHPTPAVCGVPAQAAHAFILAHEAAPRAYYSGYCGPVSPTESHLYVMLRCMHVQGQRYAIYAGGGLVAESTEEDEWQETEAKLYAMRATLGLIS